MNFLRARSGGRTTDQGTHVLLIRHAETDAVGQWLAGRTVDVGLNARGVAQAAALATELAAVPIAALHASPRRRARETAAPLAAALDLPTTIDEAFDEVDFGAWSGQSFAALAQQPAWHHYNEQRSAADIPGGEAPRLTLARVVAALASLHQRHPGAVVAAVTHAEIVRYALLLARSRSLDEWHTIDVPPAIVVPLDYLDAKLSEAGLSTYA